MQRVISAVESNSVPSQTKTIRSKFMSAPRPTGTSADPPRGCGPAWERPGARPAEDGLTQSGSCQVLQQRLAFSRQRRFQLDHLAARGVHEAQPPGVQEHALEAV